jgi:hypothetical protein
VLIARLTATLFKELKEMRRHTESLAEREQPPSDDLKAIDASLTNLGFPKPNPMLAE